MRAMPFFSLGRVSLLNMCRVDGSSGTWRKTTSDSRHACHKVSGEHDKRRVGVGARAAGGGDVLNIMQGRG